MKKRENVQLLDHLTPRETDILDQLAEGLSNREIAQKLNITVNTAKWYLRQVYSKLGAQRRTEAIMIAREIGLLDKDNIQSIDPSPKHSLPYPTTPFIGRSKELVDLANLMERSDVRLITVTGVGGVGKTRLALEVAQRHVHQFKDGVYFIPLDALHKPDELFLIVGSALNLRFQGTADARQQVIDYLRHNDILLLLDNFEHLLDGGARVVGEMLSEAAALHVLCTSRQKLNLRGEAVYAIRGLDYPGWQPSDLSDYSAVQFFMQRARLADPHIEYSEQTLQKIAHICRLVEGMPLAIELVANWISSLSLAEISAQVEHSLDVLVAELHDLPQRQQSIRAVFQHSWLLLEESEQRVLSRLSVFSGGFTLQAAQHVAEASLRVVANLSNKSLIRRDRDTNRYDMHGLARKFAREKLSDAGEEEHAYHRYAAYFSRFLKDQLLLLKGGGQTEAMAQIKAEFDNCRDAWTWAVQHKQADLIDQMIDTLHLFLQFQAWDEVGRGLFQRARDVWPAHAPDASCIGGRLSVRFPIKSDAEIRTNIFERGLKIAEQCNNLAEIAFCQRELGLQLGHRGSDDAETIQRGLNLLQASLTNHHELGDRYYEAQLLDDIGWCYTRLHDKQKRIQYSKRSIDLRKEIRDVMGLGRAVAGYLNLVISNDPDQAGRLAEEIYDIGLRFENPFLMAESRSLQAIHAMIYLGDLDRAKPLFEDALRITKQINFEYGHRNTQLPLATIICIEDEDAERAIQLIEEALPDEQTMNAEIAYFLYGTMAYLVYSALIGDYEQLASRLHPIWKLPRNQEPSPDTLWLLPFCALLTARNGDRAQAVRLLSLSVNHEMTMGIVKRLVTWSPITALQTSLRHDLGEETYARMWEEGSLLDLKEIVQGLAEWFDHR